MNPNFLDFEQPIAELEGKIGALKYADLSSDRVKDYVFDFDRMLELALGFGQAVDGLVEGAERDLCAHSLGIDVDVPRESVQVWCVVP